jgi:branched-subunit amino acid transport protein
VTLSELALIVGMALAVYAPKVLPLALVSEQLATRLRTWLRYVAPAVLGALVAPSIFAGQGSLGLPGWHGLAYLSAAIMAAVTRRMVASLVVGLVVLALTTLLAHA